MEPRCKRKFPCDSVSAAAKCGPRISLDFRGKAPGRGAYLCPDPACLKKAIRARALERAFDVKIPQEVLDGLVQAMEAQPHE